MTLPRVQIGVRRFSSPRSRGSAGWRSRTGVVLTLGLAASAAAVPLAVPASAASCSTNAGQTTCLFSATGADDSFTVPAGVTQIQVVADGAGGGTRTGGISVFAGSYGARVTSVLPVTPGEVLTVRVGTVGQSPGAGTSGAQPSGGTGGSLSSPCAGGGGGGSSTVLRGSTRLLVAGGGGGVAYGPAAGGDAGPAAPEQLNAGAVVKGGDGSDDVLDPTIGGGRGGWIAGGPRGTSPGGDFGTDGTSGGVGGNGAVTCAGAGGGGWAGGGGGGGSASTTDGGGGGAGSSYSSQPFTASRTPAAQADGQIEISYPPDQAPTISGTPPSPLQLGDSPDFTYTTTGTPAPTVSVTSGGLPPGLSLGSDGHLTGTTTATGTYTFTVTADNGVTPAASRTDTIVVQQAPTISGSPPGGSVSEPYSFSYSTSGYPAPTVGLASGSLPPGLTLSSAGVLSGTPTTAGTYSFTVSADNGDGPPATTSSTVTVRPVPSIRINNNNVVEGNSGTRPLTFHVTLSRASTVPVTVKWTSANGSATAGSDYVAAHGTLTFTPGQTSKTISVLIKGDRTREPNETLFVKLSNAHNGSIATPRGTGVIVNDD